MHSGANSENCSHHKYINVVVPLWEVFFLFVFPKYVVRTYTCKFCVYSIPHTRFVPCFTRKRMIRSSNRRRIKKYVCQRIIPIFCKILEDALKKTIFDFNLVCVINNNELCRTTTASASRSWATVTTACPGCPSRGLTTRGAPSRWGLT